MELLRIAAGGAIIDSVGSAAPEDVYLGGRWGMGASWNEGSGNGEKEEELDDRVRDAR